MLVVVATVALAVAAPWAHAETNTATDPCAEAASFLRGAAARRVPFHIEDSGLGYRRWEAALEQDLVSGWSLAPGATIARITAACRSETRRGAAPEAVAAARRLAEKTDPGSIDLGRMALCAMQDPASVGAVGAWIGDAGYPAAAAVCVAELATWPNMEGQRKRIFAGFVRRAGAFTWEVDPAVVAAASVTGRSDLLEQLVPVLADAYAHHALGYDRLRVAVCAPNDTMSEERARACATLPAQAEQRWERTGVRPWLVRGGLTVGYGGAVALTYAARDREVSRGFATAAGAVGGFVTGIAAVYFGGKALHHDVNRHEFGFKALMVGAFIAGSVLGGIGAYALSASPNSRAPVTAVGLAPLYVAAFAGTFD